MKTLQANHIRSHGQHERPSRQAHQGGSRLVILLPCEGITRGKMKRICTGLDLTQTMGDKVCASLEKIANSDQSPGLVWSRVRG
jgi:hypothetical protein